MYSGYTSPSFSSPGTIGINIEEQMLAAGDVNDQPPSFGVMGHGQGDSSNNFLDGITYRGIDQTTGMVDSTKAPSFTALDLGHGNSYNQDKHVNREYGDSSYTYSAGGQPPSVGAMVKGRVSQTSGVADPYTEDKAPSRSDLNRGTSQTGRSSDVLDGQDAQTLAGISLVGKNFKKLYPNAYYKEKVGEK